MELATVMNWYPFINRDRLKRLVAVTVIGISMMQSGCGRNAPVAPRTQPPIANDRFEEIELRIASQPVKDEFMMDADAKLPVSATFRRRIVWSGLDNREALIQLQLLDGRDLNPVIYEDVTLRFTSDHNGLLTFNGELTVPPKPGHYGILLRENVVSTSVHGVARYVLFVGKARVVRP